MDPQIPSFGFLETVISSISAIIIGGISYLITYYRFKMSHDKAKQNTQTGEKDGSQSGNWLRNYLDEEINKKVFNYMEILQNRIKSLEEKLEMKERREVELLRELLESEDTIAKLKRQVEEITKERDKAYRKIEDLEARVARLERDK